MGSLGDVARTRARLSPAGLAHARRLVATWGLLADLCFADLVLFAPAASGASGAGAGDPAGSGVPAGHGDRFVVIDHIRPTTSQTLYHRDIVGEVVDESERPLIARAFRLGEITHGEATDEVIRERVRRLCIPVRLAGGPVAVLSRESAPSVGRVSGELERTYGEVFNRFAQMIAAGRFPFPVDDDDEEAPRVGDGCLLLDDHRRVSYASPNAVSALHRIGVHKNSEGMRLDELDLNDEPVARAFAQAIPVIEDIEGEDGVCVLVRCIPLLDHRHVTGAVVLLRDVSELRVRDRLLLSKDATIREIHHRVKNNLQTISSLLQLQARRLGSPEASAAVGESVRRISSIAMVHETLARGAGEHVAFLEVLGPLSRMVEESVLAPDRTVSVKVTGNPGVLPAIVATPMAVVLNELLQNAVDHAFPASEDGTPVNGTVNVELTNDDGELAVRVADDGVGLPEGFSVDRARGLGLSIVRALVTSDLDGTIDMFEPTDGSPGTVVELRVPVDEEAQ